MNKLMIIIFIPFIITAQISTTKVNNEEQKICVSYDSTKNYLGKDVYCYEGQELYLPHKSESLRKGGWERFTDSYPKKSFYDSYKYDRLADKYFTVIKVEKATYGYDRYLLTLIEKESSKKYYFEYDPTSEFQFPFINVGFYNYVVKNSINKKFIVRGKTGLTRPPILDYASGKEVEFNSGTVWHCTGITIEDKYYSLCYQLSNEKNENVLVVVKDIDRLDWIIPVDKSIELEEKYGSDFWNIAIQNKVKIGMDKEICLIAWGKPTKINNTVNANIVSEQWVYDSKRFLYFDNGILTTIQ